MSNSNLNLSSEEIQASFEYQKDHNIWNFYNERAFLEQLFCTRFNYFLVMNGLFMGGALSASSQQNLIIILTIGFIFITLMSFVIYRAFIKLIIVLKIIYRLGDKHVFCVIDKEVKSQNNLFSLPVNHIVGIWIPLAAVLIFLVGLILAICGIFSVAG
ncbi:hypothetical protein [uncultured Sanguibacteroides sp.]|uniref:hypothetical protein n=1 Tax=uncultured Sanguibacteroides sp. TaxID=1635151 RepID=UPI0025D8AC95|nr:hypothetical protein [uncultured Sanguibacteroides sp.]